MKKLLAFLCLLPSLALAQVNPIGIDTTTGQQKVANTVTLPTSSTANVVISESDQTINGEKTFATQNGIKLPTTAPNETSGLGLSSGILSAHDGTAARTYTTLETAQNFTANKSFHSGVDALFYSDTGSTLRAAIYGDGAQAIIPIAWAGYTDNCAIGVSGSTFTISGEGGTALSATNPCLIGTRSNTSGRATVASFTANVTFTFGASSDTDGNLFGITDADWSNVMPFFLSVIYNGTTPYFYISRVPSIQSGAAASALCQKGDTDCDAQIDGMILTTGLTLASWVNLPITPVGWFNMTYATTGGAWTATVTGKTGFNYNYESDWFTFPQAQNADGGTAPAAGTHILTNAGTVPQFTTETYLFRINRNAEVDIATYYTGDAGTDGSGSVETYFAVPYALDSTLTNFYWNTGTAYVASAGALGNNMGYPQFIGSVSTTRWQITRNSTATALGEFQHGTFTNGARTIGATFKYPASK